MLKQYGLQILERNYGSKTMANVKVLRTNEQTDRRTGKKHYAPDLSMHKKRQRMFLRMIGECGARLAIVDFAG